MSYSLAYSRADQAWTVRDLDRGVVVETHATREGALESVQRLNAPEYDALETLAESSIIPEITEEILDVLEPFIREIAREGMETAEDLVSSMQTRKALSSSELNPLVDNFISSYRTTWSDNITESTRGAVRQTLQRGRKNGWTPEDVISSVRDQGFSQSRAQTIAVTETTEIYGQAAVSHYQGMGLQEWQWSTVRDPFVDTKICLPMDGRRFPVQTPFKPAHPNCRCFAVPVSLPGGQQPPEHFDDILVEQNQEDMMAALREREEYSKSKEFQGLDGKGRINDRQLEALSDYKSVGYKDVNRKLRGLGNPSQARERIVEDNIKHLDDAIEAQPGLQRNVNLYRDPGRDFWDTVGPLDDSLIGTDIVDDAYMSTSGSRLFASGWSGGDTPVMKIRAKAGQKAIAPARISPRLGDGELEVLLPRGTNLRIAGIDRDTNTVIMDIVE